MLKRTLLPTTALAALALLAAALLLIASPRPLAQAADLKVCGASDVQFIGFSDALNKQSFGGIPLTELSGITYDPERGVYYVVADRLGTTPAHFFTLTVPVNGDVLGTPFVSGVAKLAGADGDWFTGINLDGEGIALASGADVFVSSEGGVAPGAQPAVYHFSTAGGYLGALRVPPVFQIGVNNLSFEGLAMSPSKRSLFVAMEGPIAADGQTGDYRSRLRILRYEDRGIEGYVPAQQYFYLTEPGRNATELGVSDIIALSDTELLVLERGFVAGAGNTVRIYKASLTGARDVSSVASLANTPVPPLAKTPFLDLATCPDDGATVAPGGVQANKLIDNFEAMTLGPSLPGGRRLMLLLSDDNSGANQTARLIALAVPESMLTPR